MYACATLLLQCRARVGEHSLAVRSNNDRDDDCYDCYSNDDICRSGDDYDGHNIGTSVAALRMVPRNTRVGKYPKECVYV